MDYLHFVVDVLERYTLDGLTCIFHELYIPSLFLAGVLETYIYDLCVVIDPCLSLSFSGQDIVASGVIEYIDPLEEETIMLAMTPDDLHT